MKKGRFVHFTEHSDALHSLQELRDQLKKARSDPYAWKFALLAGCNALNSALICALNDTANVACLRKSSAAALLDWYEATRNGITVDEPTRFLKGLSELLRDFRKNRELFKQAKISTPEMKDLRRAIKLRNQFVHFSPTSWLIEITGMPRILNNLAHVSCSILRVQGATVNRFSYDRKLGKRLKVVEKEMREICGALANEFGEPIG